MGARNSGEGSREADHQHFEAALLVFAGSPLPRGRFGSGRDQVDPVGVRVQGLVRGGGHTGGLEVPQDLAAAPSWGRHL